MKLKFILTIAIAFSCGKLFAQQKTYPDLQAGDIAPDAVTVDAENIAAIINGACIIEKGGLYAMINLKGHFIVPWGKYKFYNVGYGHVTYGPLLSVSNPVGTSYGYINSRGNEVIPLQYYSARDFTCFGIAQVGTVRTNNLLIDQYGKLFPMPAFRPIAWWQMYARDFYNKPQAVDRMPIVETSALKKQPALSAISGFADKSGKLTIPALYYNTGFFTEGMAPVASMDKFNAVRWGFINEAGKQVIPFTFQIQPGNFHNGLALVRPKEKTDFDYAYIDKSGNIKLKIKSYDGHSNYRPAGINVSDNISITPDPNLNELNGLFNTVGYFVKGYSFWKGYQDEVSLLDTLGNFHKLEAIVKDPQIAHSNNGLSIFKYDDIGIYYQVIQKGVTSGNNIGLVDYNGNTIFKPVYNTLIPDLYGTSAIASQIVVNTPYPTTVKQKNVKGVVNSQGVFILTLAGKPTF